MAFKHVARMTKYLRWEGWNDSKIIDLIQYMGGEEESSGYQEDTYYGTDRESGLDTTEVVSADELMARLNREKENRPAWEKALSVFPDKTRQDPGSSEAETDGDGSDATMPAEKAKPGNGTGREKAGSVKDAPQGSPGNDKGTDEKKTESQPQKKEAPMRPGHETEEAKEQAGVSGSAGFANTGRAQSRDTDGAGPGDDKEKKNKEEAGQGHKKQKSQAPSESITGKGPGQESTGSADEAGSRAAAAAGSPPVSKYTPVDRLKKEDITYSLLKITIIGFDGKEVQTSVLSAPLTPAEGGMRILGVMVGGKIKRTLFVSDPGAASVKLDVSGYPVTVSAYAEDGAYRTRCTLPQGYEQDGTRIVFEETHREGKGHIIISRADACFHIIPTAYANVPKWDNRTPLLVCAELADGTMLLKHSDKDLYVRMNVSGKDLVLFSSWDDSGYLCPKCNGV